jgi:thiosulfate dehydrogenase (quinone) large subunit
MAATTRDNDTDLASRRVNVLADDAVGRGAALLVRLIAAALWLDNLSWKVPPDFGRNDNAGLYFFTHLAVDHPVFGPWTYLVEHVVLPNFQFFGWVTLLAEGSLAIFLFLGVLTRLWAVIGIAQSVAIFLSVGASPNEWKWSYFLMIAAHLAILGFAAGRVLGVDAWLRNRLRDATGWLPRLVRIAS